MADGVALRLNQVSYTAQSERLFAALGLMPDQASGLAVREGRRLGPGLECTISGDGLSVVVQPGVCTVSHALTAGGDYQVAVAAAVTKTLGAKPGVGLKRRDTVVVDVLDADVTQKATALREANIALLSGAATSGTPVAPAAGTMQFEIGQVHFDGTNTPVIQATNPRYTWAAGGIGKVYSTTERNALAAYDGLVVYRADLNQFQERVAGAWRDSAEPVTDTGWSTYAVSGGWTNAGTRMRKVGNRVRLEISVTRAGASLPLGTFANIQVLNVDPDDRPGANPDDSILVAVGNNAQGGQVSFGLDSGDGVLSAWSS
ncbi:MAG: hypothetical protein ACRD0P_03325, partial [Stackebrandtia sp.]